jgi:hypothetical protein
MTYADQFSTIMVSQEMKPKYGKPCNHCGWCCLTEVCPSGVEYGNGSEDIPCQFIATSGDRHYCELLITKQIKANQIAAGTGCDAKTQLEQIRGFTNVDL